MVLCHLLIELAARTHAGARSDLSRSLPRPSPLPEVETHDAGTTTRVVKLNTRTRPGPRSARDTVARVTLSVCVCVEKTRKQKKQNTAVERARAGARRRRRRRAGGFHRIIQLIAADHSWCHASLFTTRILVGLDLETLNHCLVCYGCDPERRRRVAAKELPSAPPGDGQRGFGVRRRVSGCRGVGSNAWKQARLVGN